MLNQVEATNEYPLNERRAHSRAPRSIALMFDEEGETRMVTTENVSASGLYLYTKTELTEGSFLTLRMPNGDDDLITVHARVIHNNPGHGAGVRFHSLSENDRATLEAYTRTLFIESGSRSEQIAMPAFSPGNTPASM
jgi:hypothetical protein